MTQLRTYVVALAILAIALAGRELLEPYLGHYLLFSTVFIAVLLAGWYCGVGPALLIVVVGYPAVEYLVRPEIPGLAGAETFVAARLALYILLCAIIVSMIARFRRQHDALARALARHKAQEDRLYHHAHFDDLTGLAKRGLFFDRLSQASIQAKRERKAVALLFIDLDHFKEVNDTHGHHAGDELLQQIARTLVGAVRGIDTVARLGGDEFAIIFPSIDRREHAALLAQAVLEALRDCCTVAEKQAATVTASIGVAVSSDIVDDKVQTLVKAAGLAICAAKKKGENAYEVFTPDMLTEQSDKRHLQQRLRDGLAEREFVLHYQPKIALDTGQITGCEALLRWQPPDGTLVMPQSFIWLLEESGLIISVGDWVIRAACEQAGAWQKSGIVVPISVNVSVIQITQPGFADKVTRALRESGIDGQLLEIELTESAVMHNPDAVVPVLSALKALGVKIAVDDFGTGHSSLALLKRLPVDVLKIDRSFVSGLPTNENDVSITRAIITMAHSLHLKVVAEGIEASEQQQFLKDHGCNYGQGYLIGKPMPSSEFAAIQPTRATARILDLAQARVARRAVNQARA